MRVGMIGQYKTNMKKDDKNTAFKSCSCQKRALYQGSQLANDILTKGCDFKIDYSKQQEKEAAARIARATIGYGIAKSIFSNKAKGSEINPIQYLNSLYETIAREQTLLAIRGKANARLPLLGTRQDSKSTKYYFAMYNNHVRNNGSHKIIDACDYLIDGASRLDPRKDFRLDEIISQTLQTIDSALEVLGHKFKING